MGPELEQGQVTMTETKLVLPSSVPPYRAAPAMSIAVVSARTPEGVYRAVYFNCWSDRVLTVSTALVASLVHVLGRLHLSGVEWTGYIYELPPHYLCDLTQLTHAAKLYERNGVYHYPWAKTPEESKWKGSMQDYGLISDNGEFVQPLLQTKDYFG